MSLIGDILSISIPSLFRTGAWSTLSVVVLMDVFCSVRDANGMHGDVQQQVTDTGGVVTHQQTRMIVVVRRLAEIEAVDPGGQVAHRLDAIRDLCRAHPDGP